ncbi:MAG: hypothetical protein ACI4A7_01465 [Prevotella sp.]
MSTQAHVSSEALQVLLDGFQSCASSVASLQGAVRAHIAESLSNAKNVVAKLRFIEASALERYESCRIAYTYCRERQKYDEESGEYRPSCSCEERDMKNAEDVYYKARSVREQSEMCLHEMEREVDAYEQPMGGEGIMNSITDEYVPQATERLTALKEKVVRYENLAITGIDVDDSNPSTPILQAPRSEALAFGKATERLQEKRNRRAALFGNYCPRCKCCPCECDNIRDMLMSRIR